MFKANFSNFIFAKITVSSNGFTAKGITYDGDLKETFVSFDNIKDEVWGKIFPQATAPQVEATAPQVEATAPQVEATQVEATAPQFTETAQIKRGRGRPRKIVA